MGLSGSVPGGMRRFSRAAARGTMAAVDPSTGGQSMPRMVTAGRAHSMSLTLPSPRSDRRRAHQRRFGTAQADTAHPSRSACCPARDRGVALVSRSVASIATSAASASGAGPPNIPECTSDLMPDLTTTLTMPRRLTVAAGRPTAALPVSQTRIASARSRSAFFGTKSSRPPVPCSSTLRRPASG